MDRMSGCPPLISAMPGSTNRKITVQAGIGIKGDPTLKITRAKRAWEEWLKLVECIPSRSKALNSSPSTSKT
jgi:hypothetical protein